MTGGDKMATTKLDQIRNAFKTEMDNNGGKLQTPIFSQGSSGVSTPSQPQSVPTFSTPTPSAPTPTKSTPNSGPATPQFTVPNGQPSVGGTFGGNSNSSPNDYWAQYGSKDAYASSQQNRYDEAWKNNDTTLIGNLEADAKRAGYTLKGPNSGQVRDQITSQQTPELVVPGANGGPFVAPNPTQQIPTFTSQNPVRDEAAIRKYAEEQTDRKLRDLGLYCDQQIRDAETTANQQLGNIQTQYDRTRETMGEDRSLEDNQNARNWSPFSGRSDYAAGMVAQQRGRTDREMQQDLSSRQNNVNQDLANLRNTMNEKYAALQNARPDEVNALIQSILQDERNYELAMNGQQIQGALANSQLNNDAFNRAYQQYAANRAAFESDRGFNYGTYSDQVNWTGNVPVGGYSGYNPYAAQASVAGGSAQPAQSAAMSGQAAQGGQAAPQQMQRTLAGQAMDQQIKQGNWNAYLDMVDRTGNLGAGPSPRWGSLVDNAGKGAQTLAGQQWAYQQGRDKVMDNRWQQEFDYGKGRDNVKDSQWDKQFAESVRQFGIESAARQAGITMDQARLAMQREQMNLDEDYRWASLDGKLAGDASPPKYSGLTPNKVLDSLKPQVLGADGKRAPGVTAESIYRSVVGYGLPDGQDDQVMMSLGLTKKEIEGFDKQFGVNSGNFSSLTGGGAYKNYYKADKDAKANPKAYQAASSAVSSALKASGKPDTWLKPLLELVARESSFNPNAKNPKSTARGLFQFLDGTRKNYGGGKVDWSDPYQQAVAGIQYVIDRYGTPEKALQFWDKNKWY